MPYIKADDKVKFDEGLNSLLKAFGRTNWTAGDLNYVVSALTWRLFEAEKRYQRANDIMGALEGAKLEFYRRKVSQLEDKKILENGDVLV